MEEKKYCKIKINKRYHLFYNISTNIQGFFNKYTKERTYIENKRNDHQ